jgi:hypothetical protein
MGTPVNPAVVVHERNFDALGLDVGPGKFRAGGFELLRSRYVFRENDRRINERANEEKNQITHCEFREKLYEQKIKIN